jgi:serine/threonine protein kinase
VRSPKKQKLTEAGLKLQMKKAYKFLEEIDLDDEEVQMNAVFVKPKTKDDEKLEKIEERTNMKHPNLIPSALIDRSSKSSFPYFRLKDTKLLKFEAPPEGGSLLEIIKERTASGEKFNEEEIYKTLYELVSCLALFERNGITHGDLNSETIFYDTDENKFKIYDHELMCGSKIMGFWRAFKHHQRVYLSPELLRALEHKDCDISIEIARKSDVFALGMVLLETATLEDSEPCYDFYQFSVARETIDARLEKIKEIYSKNLYHMINYMLKEDWKERPTPGELKGKLKLFFSNVTTTTNAEINNPTPAQPPLETVELEIRGPRLAFAPQLRKEPLKQRKQKMIKEHHFIPVNTSNKNNNNINLPHHQYLNNNVNIIENPHLRRFSYYVPSCYTTDSNMKMEKRRIKVDYRNNLMYEVPFGTISAMPRITYVGGRVSIGKNEYPAGPLGHNILRLNTDGPSSNRKIEIIERRTFTNHGPPHGGEFRIHSWSQNQELMQSFEDLPDRSSIVIERTSGRVDTNH